MVDVAGVLQHFSFGSGAGRHFGMGWVRDTMRRVDSRDAMVGVTVGFRGFSQSPIIGGSFLFKAFKKVGP